MSGKKQPGESPTHEELGTAIGKLVDKKNQAYSNTFEKVGRILPIMVEDLTDQQVRSIIPHIIVAGRILDKLVRNLRNQAMGKDPMKENPKIDAIGYLLLGLRTEVGPEDVGKIS